jgi:CD109 antigen
LVYAQKDTSLLVQLEKAIYSPGQTVKYRIFAIDSLTNAVNPSDKCSVTIRDSNGNLIEEFSGPKFVKGKYEHVLSLGLKAPEGIWGLQVQCGIEVSLK